MVSPNEIVREHSGESPLTHSPLPEGFAPSAPGQVSEKPPGEYLSSVKPIAELATKPPPEILLSVILLARFSQKPTVENWSGLTHLICSLARTRKISLNLLPAGPSSEVLDCYSHASWASQLIPTSHGLVIRLYECPIFWASQTNFGSSRLHSHMDSGSGQIAVSTGFDKIRLDCDTDSVGKVHPDRPLINLVDSAHETSGEHTDASPRQEISLLSTFPKDSRRIDCQVMFMRVFVTFSFTT
ncbi:hypothetical protein PGT21_008919 [Puccinia graminis f. sp. tritici]|uniref:Uncharacterized protein n=1 Tax=Puccinia graminis f. sp. tritici TaxID=56615 RepID=A0A5B0N3N4_PUCGR|nr:hypothetical protein PGTUg99_027819 [Puccinia graminis f. sp. tritici]KAA1083845.1 hypothetical protein PGT21_008919 [Puccinia graminis f. sp. tritici]